MSIARDRERKQIEDVITQRPESAYARRVAVMGVEREVDWGLILDANYTVGHGVSLVRYPNDPEVKAAIRAAREALGHLVDVYNDRVAEPAWEVFHEAELRRREEAGA